MKIALVKLSSLGDIIFGMSVLQKIKTYIPESKITWVADKKFADILDYNPDLEHIIKIDLKGLKNSFSFNNVLNEYKQLLAYGKFDLVIDLQGMIKAAVISRIVGNKVYGIKSTLLKEPLSKWFYNNSFAFGVPLSETTVARNISLVSQCLNLPKYDATTEIKPYLFWGAEDDTVASSFLAKDKKNIILIAGSSSSFKNYPVEKFARLANLLPGNVIVSHGSDKELQTATMIAKLADNITVLPRLTLNELKAVIGKSDLVIGGDSGPTHIAAACGVKSITLFAHPACVSPTVRNRVVVAPLKNSGSLPIRSISDIYEVDIFNIALELLGS